MSISNKNSEIIKSYYQAFNDKNWKKMLSHLSDDVAHDINQGSTQMGLAEFEKFLNHMDECYEERLEDLVIFGHESGRIAAEFYVHGVYKKTDQGLPRAHGQTYALRAGAFFELNSRAKISRITMYYNLQEWLRLIGS